MAALRYGAIRTCVSVPFGSLQVQNESSYTRRSLNLIEKSPLAYVTDILIIRQKGQRSRSRGPVRNSNRRRVITDKTSAAEKLTLGGAARFNRVTAWDFPNTAKLAVATVTVLRCIAHSLHCALAAAKCSVIGPVCGFVAVFVCLWVCYHDNSKLRASILTKLGL